MTAPFRICVPTASALLHQQRNGKTRWLTFTSPEKFPGKILFPGGKRKPLFGVPHAYTPAEDCLCTEVAEEVGLTIEKSSLLLFGLATDPNRDVRQVKLGKATDGTCPTELADLPVLASFGCPDSIYIAECTGEPVLDGREGKEAVWLDLDEPVDPDRFGAGHGALAVMLKAWWVNKATTTPKMARPSADDLADFSAALLRYALYAN